MMNTNMLNPFIYGKPVPAERHVDRHQALTTVFSRIYNKESTVIVGEPQIGKTSLMQYVLSQQAMSHWLKDDAEKIIFITMDIYAGWKSPNKTPRDFWEYVFKAIKTRTDHLEITREIGFVEKDLYDINALEVFFEKLSILNKRILLAIDEFDSLLYHPNFAQSGFFGEIRSLATRLDGFQIIASSTLSVAEMTKRAENEHPTGSPPFNYLGEVKLEMFDKKATKELIRASLEATEIKFRKADLDFVTGASGGHPYRLQVACAAVYDAIISGKTGEKRYEYAAEKFLIQANQHYLQIWKLLNDKARTVLVIMSMMQLGGRVLGKDFSFGEIEKTQSFEPELQVLSKIGLVEVVGENKDLDWDAEHYLLWRNQRWRISSEGVIWWLTSTIIGDNRIIPDFDNWLHDQEVIGYILTRKQWGLLNSWIKKIPATLGESISSAFLALIKGFFRKNNL